MTAGMILLFIWRLEAFSTRFMIEHEILIRDYCQRHDIEVEELPTRMNVGLSFTKRRS